MSSIQDKKAKNELDAARMRGDLPPEVDKEGNLINPHIPEFMAKAPWYLHQGEGSGLAHQKKGGNAPVDQSIAGLEQYYRRGQTAGRATVFRKGSCRNCGSATHTEKQCTDRPRKVGAWKTGTNISADEVLPAPLTLGWDAKRDQYAGYDGGEHQLTVEKFAAIEEERRKIREEQRQKDYEAKIRKKAEKEERKAKAREEKRAAKKAAKAAANGSADGSANGAGAASSSSAAAPNGKADREDADTASDAGTGTDDDATDSDTGTDTDTDTDYSDSDADEDLDRGTGVSKDSAEGAGGGKKGDKKLGGEAKMTAWNVRVREDTAKYLLNLDTESAFYDPKTRSMRENPFPDKVPGVDVVYAGDNQWKNNATVAQMAQDQLFAWEAAERGQEVHMQANPTQTALLKKQFAERKAAVEELKRQKLLARYGSGGADASSSSAASGSGGLIVADDDDADGGAAGAGGRRRIVGAPARGPAGAGSSSAAGNEFHTEMIPAELRLGVQEGYVEYTRDGKVIQLPTKGPAMPPPQPPSSTGAGASSSSGPVRSMYQEDVHPGNHKAIYGSWFDKESMQWGYACCHSTIHSSYCTGAVGREAADSKGPGVKRPREE